MPENPITGLSSGDPLSGLLTGRDAVYQALFDWVSSSPVWKTKDRKLKLWGDVPKSERPAIFQQETDEDVVGGSGGSPSLTTLKPRLLIYTNAESADVPASLLNKLCDIVTATLSPNPITGMQNLGGMCQHAWITGTIIKDPGDLDGDGLAMIPISVTVPTFSLFQKEYVPK